MFDIEKILAFFRPAPSRFEPGALVDDRPQSEKDNDAHIDEIVAAAALVEWKELTKDEIRQFSVQNQGFKSNCVAESRRKMKRILWKMNYGVDLDFSSVEFYRRRPNFSEPGMRAPDAIALDEEEGMTLDALVPSDAIRTEKDANALTILDRDRELARSFRSHKEITFTPGDLDTPCGTIQVTGKGVMAWYFFTQEEWSTEIPVVLDKTLTAYEPRALRHSVVMVTPAIYRGEEGVWIDDSAHFGGISRRFITREFHTVRNFWTSYTTKLRFEEGQGVRPRYTGTIRSLQDCLKFEGYFPADRDSTGFYGSLTRDAVAKFQTAHGLEAVGVVGPLTRKKLLELYP